MPSRRNTASRFVASHLFFPFSPLDQVTFPFHQAVPADSLSPRSSWIIKKAFSPSLRAAQRTVRSFINAKILEGRRRVRVGEAGLSLLDVILEKEYREELEGGGRLRLEEVRDELNTFLLA